MTATEATTPEQSEGEAPLLATLNRILEDAGIYVAAEIRGNVLSLSGEVDSIENRDAALDVAHALADPRGLSVEDNLEIMPTFPEEPSLERSGFERGDYGYLTVDRDHDLVLDPEIDDEPDFAGDVGATNPGEAAAEGIPYFAPTDPVVRPSTDVEALEVVGGFEATSMDDDQRAASFDIRPDEEITDDVLRELREDALTTDLQILVHTRNGVVYLRGEVPTLEDAENAEAVASRVGGVKEVREELVVTSIRDARRR